MTAARLRLTSQVVNPQQFRGAVHSIELSADGFVCVADRSSNCIQVFGKDGTFVKEATLAPATLDMGSVWDMALSKDPAEQWPSNTEIQSGDCRGLIFAHCPDVSAKFAVFKAQRKAK